MEFIMVIIRYYVDFKKVLGNWKVKIKEKGLGKDEW